MEIFFAIVLTHFLALLSPGPDFFLILSTLLRQGNISAKVVCIGIAVGNAGILLLIYLSLFYLGKINPLLLQFMHYAGALYLLYLAYQCFVYAKEKISLNQQNVTSLSTVDSKLFNFSKDLQSSLLNPKNLMFYSSLIILVFYKYQTWQILGLSIWMVMVVLIWNIFLVQLLSQKKWIDSLLKKSKWLFYGSGCCFVIFAILLLFI